MGMDQLHWDEEPMMPIGHSWEGELEFLSVVRRLRRIGYGRMLQIISHEWWGKDRNGAQVANTTFGQLTPFEQIGFESLRQQDPLFTEEK